MRTYRPRPTDLRHCVHCHAPFESNHKRRIYCGNSCSTLAYYARKAAAPAPALPLGTLPAAAAEATAEGPAAPAVTLAVNLQNTLVLTASSLLADAIKHLAGKLFASPPQAGPSTWLPAELLAPPAPLLPLVPLQHADWPEPLFFRPLPYEGELYYFRASQELLFWQDPQGKWHQVTTWQAFKRLTTHLRIYHRAQQFEGVQLEALPVGVPGLKTLG